MDHMAANLEHMIHEITITVIGAQEDRVRNLKL
jgi:hypothetical protein